MESVFPQIGPKIGLSSACGALEHKVRRSFRGIGGTLRNRSGNEAESQRERRSLRLRRCRWRAQAPSRCRLVRTSPAARRIERTIPWYPVQRQRSPLIAARTAAAVLAAQTNGGEPRLLAQDIGETGARLQIAGDSSKATEQDCAMSSVMSSRSCACLSPGL